MDQFVLVVIDIIDLDEFELVRTDDESDHVLQGEENNHEVIDEVNDVGEPVVLNGSVLVLLQLLRGAVN